MSEASVEGTSLAADLTDNEGSLLGLVGRRGPVTAYQLVKIYERSPVNSFNSSTGGLYPIINRLKRRGLIHSRPVEGDGRGTEQLECSELGHEAIKTWVQTIRPSHTLLEDPLRTKVMSFGHLSRREQIEWVKEVRERLTAKLRELEEYSQTASVPYQNIVHANAVGSLHARLSWLDEVEREILKEKV